MFIATLRPANVVGMHEKSQGHCQQELEQLLKTLKFEKNASRVAVMVWINRR